MRKMLFPALSALALVCGGTLAAQTVTVVLTPEQQVMYDAWSAAEQAGYETWPADYRTYYWTLTPNQQRGWWMLSADQRTQIYVLTPDQRITAWNSIEAQMTAAAPVPAAAPVTRVDAATAAGVVATTTVVSNALPPPPAASLNKTYPVCTRTLQDNCQNPGEGGAPGRSRAIPVYRPKN
ncbi:MAG: hypothetical protein ACREBO_08465 [Novosphingobium sp.]